MDAPAQLRSASLEATEVAQQLGVDPAQGLSADEARRRLQEHGPNRLTATKKESGFQAFLRQYQDFMQIVLLAAAVINLIATQDVGTSVVLAGLTLFNAVIGLPHPDFGEGVCAVVIGKGEEATMIAECRKKLAAFKTPKRILFVSDLPRNAMGKVQKNLLRQAYADTFN